MSGMTVDADESKLFKTQLAGQKKAGFAGIKASYKARTTSGLPIRTPSLHAHTWLLMSLSYTSAFSPTETPTQQQLHEFPSKRLMVPFVCPGLDGREI